MHCKMKQILVLAVVVFALVGCRRTDVRSFAVVVPQATEADVPALVAELGKFGGVEKSTIKFDAATHRLTMRYDSMQLAKKNIEMAIAALGFKANDVTPESIGVKPR